MNVAKNKIKFGLNNVHIAGVDEDPVTHEITATEPEPVDGAVTLSLTAQGDPVEFYADNRKYFEQFVNDGYQGSLEFALIPSWFKTKYLNERVDSQGVQTENAGAMQKHFALLFEFQGDAKATRHVLYYCLASRPNIESGTKTKTIEPKTETLTLAAGPRPDTGDVKSSTTEETQPAAYADWYKAVYMPTSEPDPDPEEEG